MKELLNCAIITSGVIPDVEWSNEDAKVAAISLDAKIKVQLCVRSFHLHE